MMLLTTFGVALRMIRRNPMRSFLTMLGVVIGVASVVALVTLGRGATARVTSDVASLGNHLLIVLPGADRRTPGAQTATPFDGADVRAIVDEIPGLAAVAPSAGTGARVVFGNRNWSTTITGSTNAFLEARNWTIEKGRTFNESELRSGTPVCILGHTVVRELFGESEALDQSIRIARVSCRVVGVLRSKGQSAFGGDQDDFVLMPLVAFQRRVAGKDDVGVIYISTEPNVSMQDVQHRIQSLMRRRRHIRQGDEDDFTVRDLAEVAQVLSGITGVLTGLLGAIAAVSLVVGGIGIMNVMLVSVTERTREIGLRLAIGALSRDVLLQFLVESVTISSLGGAVGVVLGLGGSAIAARSLGLPFVFAPDVALLAFAFAASVGVFFGLYPAIRASRLDPIEALRHE